VLDDSRTEVVYDDAAYILTTRENSTSSPQTRFILVKGAATLYTKEYFEQVRRHLNLRTGHPMGALYESNSAVVKSEIATFWDVFPTLRFGETTAARL